MDHQENIRRKSSSLPGYTRGFHDAFLSYSPSSACRWEGVKVAAKPVPVAAAEGRNPENMDANGSLTVKEKKKKWSGWGAFFRRTKTTSKKSSSSEHSSDSEPAIPSPKPRHCRQGNKQELDSKVEKTLVAHPALIRDTVRNASITTENAVPAAKAPDVVPSNSSTSARFPLHGHERRDVFTNKGLVNRNGESLSSEEDSRASLLNRSQDSLASSNASRRSRGARTERYLQRKSRDAEYMHRDARMHKSASPQYAYDQTKPSCSPNISRLHRGPPVLKASSTRPESSLGIPYPFVDSTKPVGFATPSGRISYSAQKLSAPPTPPPRNPMSKSYLLKVTPSEAVNRPTSCSFGQLRHDYQNVHKENQLASNLSPKLGARPYSAVHFSQVPVRKNSQAPADAPNFQRHWIAASPDPSHSSSTSSIPPLIPPRGRLSSTSFSPPVPSYKKSPSPYSLQSDITRGNLSRKSAEPPAVPPKMFRQQQPVLGCKRTGSLSSQSSELSTPSSKFSSEDSTKGYTVASKPLRLPGESAAASKMDTTKEHQHVRGLSKLKPSTDKNLEQAICELEEIYDSLRLSDEDLMDRAERRDLPTPHQELSRGAASSSSCCSESDRGEILAGVTSDLDTMMNWSISGSFESLVYPAQARMRAPATRRSAIPDKVGDDMAVRRLSSKPDVKPQSVLAKSGSYLLVSAAISGKDAPPTRHSDSSDPDIVLDDVAFRNIRQANSMKIIDPQPPFGIPLGPVTPAPLTDYLHANAKEKRRSLFRPMRFPDLVKDDLAYRNLRKDGGQGPSLGPPGLHVNTEKLDDILREANSKDSSSLRKKRAVRSMSANITHLVRQESMKPCGGEETENFFNCSDFTDIESVVQDLIIPQETLKAVAKLSKRKDESSPVPGLAALYPKSALLEKRKSASPKRDLDETFDNLIADLSLDSNSQPMPEENHLSAREENAVKEKKKVEQTTWNDSPLFAKEHPPKLPQGASDHGETSGESREVQEILKHVVPGEDELCRLESISSSCMSRVVATANSLHDTLTADDDCESSCMSRDSAFATDAGSSDDGTCSSLNVSSEFSCRLTDFMFCESPAVSSSPSVEGSHEDVTTPSNSLCRQVSSACNYTLADNSSDSDRRENCGTLDVHNQVPSQPSLSLTSGAPNVVNTDNLREPTASAHHRFHSRKSKHRSSRLPSEEESSSNDEDVQQHSSYSHYRQQRKQTKQVHGKETSNSDDTGTNEQHLLRIDCSPHTPFRRFIRRNSPNVTLVKTAENENAKQHGKQVGSEPQPVAEKSQAVLLRTGKSLRPNKDKSTKRKSNLNRSFNEEQITPTSEEDAGKRSRLRRAHEAAVSYSSAETDQQSTSEILNTKIHTKITDQAQSAAATKIILSNLENKVEDKEAAAGVPWRQAGKTSRVSDITARIEALNSLAKQTATRVDKLTSRSAAKLIEVPKEKPSSGSEVSVKEQEQSLGSQDSRGAVEKTACEESNAVEVESCTESNWDVPWRKRRPQQQNDLREPREVGEEPTSRDEMPKNEEEAEAGAVEAVLSDESAKITESSSATDPDENQLGTKDEADSQVDDEPQNHIIREETTSSPCSDHISAENVAESTIATAAENIQRPQKGMVRCKSLENVNVAVTNMGPGTSTPSDSITLRASRSLNNLLDKDSRNYGHTEQNQEASSEAVEEEPLPVEAEDPKAENVSSVLTTAKEETVPLAIVELDSNPSDCLG